MKKIFVLLTVCFPLVLSGCFSEYDSGEGAIKISLGGSAARVAVKNPGAEITRYELTLTSSGKSLAPINITGSATVSVPAGKWELNVRAYGPTPLVFGDGEGEWDTFPYTNRFLRGLGETTIEVKTGQTSEAVILMVNAVEVRNWEQLVTASQNVAHGTHDIGKEEIIVIKENIELSAALSINPNGLTTITFIADGKDVTLTRVVEVTATDNDYLIDHSQPNLHLILGKPGMKNTLTLKGCSTASVVNVTAGELRMYDGVIITGGGGTNDGGVYVGAGGTFTMYGGTISGNTATNGSGVYVENGGHFTKNGGTIYGEIYFEGQ
jgi:hypothetical protein